jgi:hypothetical protein
MPTRKAAWLRTDLGTSVLIGMLSEVPYWLRSPLSLRFEVHPLNRIPFGEVCSVDKELLRKTFNIFSTSRLPAYRGARILLAVAVVKCSTMLLMIQAC